MIIELKTLDQIDPCQLAYHANEQSIGNYLRNSFPYPYTLDHAMSFITHSLENHGLDFGIVVDGKRPQLPIIACMYICNSNILIIFIYLRPNFHHYVLDT